MNRFESAKSMYASLGVDVEAALERLAKTPISIHCWQGDDVVGFDSRQAASGGIQTTGNYPGRATTPEELMADFDMLLRLTPGCKKINLHASYAIFGEDENVGRNELEPRHFAAWVDYAKARGLGIDFNPTFFSHPPIRKSGTTGSSTADAACVLRNTLPTRPACPASSTTGCPTATRTIPPIGKAPVRA